MSRNDRTNRDFFLISLRYLIDYSSHKILLFLGFGLSNILPDLASCFSVLLDALNYADGSARGGNDIHVNLDNKGRLSRNEAGPAE